MTRRNAFSSIQNLFHVSVQRVIMFACVAALASSAPQAHGQEDELDNLPVSKSLQYDTPQALEQAYKEAGEYFGKRKYFTAANIYFNISTTSSSYQKASLARLTESLIRVKLYNAASYFFIKTLQEGEKSSVRSILKHLPEMVDNLGIDLLRSYVVKHTAEADYDNNTKNHFYYFIGKNELLKNNTAQALAALSKVTSGSGILAQAALMKATAYAISGQQKNAIAAFESCRSIASGTSSRSAAFNNEMDDLEARCTAGLARVYYEMGKYDEAESTYDDIGKSTFVWTDILFEQAWNAFAKGDFNRALGKLVTYRSPSLKFVFNPEVVVLRAQIYMTLCMYDDANKAINEFNSEYGDVGIKIKNFLTQNEHNLPAFFTLAKGVYGSKLHSDNMLNRAVNRFIRGPYFADLIEQDKSVAKELAQIRKFYPGIKQAEFDSGFGGFLTKVLDWRKKSVTQMGGMFVKNTLLDLYQELLADFDKASFIKLDMLGKAKSKIEKTLVQSEDEDGILKKGKATIDRRDYQYFWNFNGEFWIDELGDYVFALDSECGA